MLLEFRVANFRSFAAEKRFSMVAGTGKELLSNTATVKGFAHSPLLRSAAIYGANASGKTSLIRAFEFLRSFVLRSSESSQDDDKINILPFLLDPVLENKPSEFEISFLLNEVRHQYGVIVSRERVHEEWLTVYPKGKPQEWFRREVKPSGESVFHWNPTHLKGAKTQLGQRALENVLFLSVAAQWNHQQLKPIHRWFRNSLKVLHLGFNSLDYTRSQLLKDASFCDWMTSILKAADVGISRVRAMEVEVRKEQIRFPGNMPTEVKDYLTAMVSKNVSVEVKTSRSIPNSNRVVEWDLAWESDGTQRMVELLGPIRDVLESGAVLIIDELDKSLHAHIMHAIVQLFNQPETNPNHAQLIFTTHDTSLLDLTVFRRDQIWFTTKDDFGATDLYSLQDYSPRLGEAIQKGYLSGRYGGVPIIEQFKFSPSQSPRLISAGDSSEE